MSLLDEIEADATSDSVPVAQMLRKCQILASRLDNAPLAAWVAWELNGYPEGIETPHYRQGYHANLYAYMSGPFGSHIKNQRVPETILPEWVREQYLVWEFRQSVGELQSLVDQAAKDDSTLVHRGVPPEICASLPQFVVGYTPMEINAVLPTTAISGLLDRVRNRALAFVLELEKEAPTVGEKASTARVDPERVTQIFNTTIMGGNVNWAAGNVGAQVVESVRPGDLEALFRRLTELGIEEADRQELRSALHADAQETGPKPGPRAREWLAAITLKTSVDVGKAATAALVARALLAAVGAAP